MPSPELDAYLQARATMPRPAPGQPLPDTTTRRGNFDRSSPQAPADIRAFAVSAGGVPSEWVLAPRVDESVRLAYFHGGGYTVGSIRSHRRIAADLSRAAGCAVLNVDYRLAPEHAPPAQRDDAAAAYAWMLANGPSGPSAARATFIAGDSAGGGLSLTLLQHLRDSGLAQPAAAATFSAWTDMSASGASIVTRQPRDPIFGAVNLGVAGQNFARSTPVDAPLVSPVFGDFTGLAPLYLNAGDDEMLLDDTLRVAARASDAGVEVSLHIEPAVFHVYPFFVPDASESIRAIEAAAAFLKRHAER